MGRKQGRPKQVQADLNITPQKIIWSRIFNTIDLSFMKKNYNIIVYVGGVRSRKRSYIQCLPRWKTFAFQLLHVSNPFQKTPDVFNLTEWEGMLSSRCILNMKRLVTLKYKQRKSLNASLENVGGVVALGEGDNTRLSGAWECFCWRLSRDSLLGLTKKLSPDSICKAPLILKSDSFWFTRLHICGWSL